jgi:eukaryotic-like serine/threonine-protein kinase
MPLDRPDEHWKSDSGAFGVVVNADGFASTPPPSIPDHELIRRIGDGSYGEVWLAKNLLGSYRASKIVYRKTFQHDHPFEREFKGIRKFEPISRTHEGLVDILQVGRGDGYFFYRMELADEAKNPKPETRSPKEIRNPNDEANAAHDYLRPSTCELPSDFVIRNSDFYAPRTLASELQQRTRLPVDECVRLGLSLVSALGHLHRHGLVHRDVKPSNIIFVRGGPKQLSQHSTPAT